MPTESEFQLALEEVARYVESIDNSIEDENVEELAGYEDEEGVKYTFSGHRCSNEGTLYIVVGHPEFEFFSCIQYLGIKSFIGEALSEEDIDWILGEDLETNQDRREAAVEELFSRMDENEIEKAATNIKMHVSGSGSYSAEVEIHKEAYSFALVERKLFPYRDDFDIKEFYDTVMLVDNVSQKAQEAIYDSIRLYVPESEDEEYSLEVKVN